MTTYNPDRFIPDTASDGPLGVDAHRVPVPPVEWGPGMLVRDPVNRGWQWTPPPPPNSRWEPAQPPATGDRPILIATWYEPAGGGFTSSRKCTGRIRKEVDTNGPRNPDGSLFEYITIAFSANDVESWSEARPKERHGELGMNREQATYLRDALTAMLERGK